MTGPATVHGTVLSAGSAAPREGLLVELRLEGPEAADGSEDSIVDRTSTDGNGRFRLEMGEVDYAGSVATVSIRDGGETSSVDGGGVLASVDLESFPKDGAGLEITVPEPSGRSRLLPAAAVTVLGMTSGCVDWAREQFGDGSTADVADDPVEGDPPENDSAEDGDGDSVDDHDADGAEEPEDDATEDDATEDETESGSGGSSGGGSSGGSGGSSGSGGSGGSSDSGDDGGGGDEEGSSPDAPTGLTAVVSEEAIDLEWNSVEDADEYTLYWSTAEGVTPESGISIESVSSPHTHESVDEDTRYYYVVTASNDAGEGSPSEAVDAILESETEPPTAPSGLTAVASDDSIALEWNPVEGADGYTLYWSTTEGVTPESGTAVESVTSPHTNESVDEDTRYYYVVTASNDAGESGPSVEVDAIVAGETLVLDPPELDTTTRTTIQEQSKFLYEGDDPPQTDVDLGRMEPHRSTVLQGRTKTREGDPLANVTIKIDGRPEFGTTRTRADGRFDMAINGGGTVVVRFEREGYLPVQRKLRPKWRRYENVPDVALIPEDPKRTTIDMDVADWQVVRASEMEDLDGTRRAELFVPPETSAVNVDDGTAPTRLEISATEFTVGENGPETMPGRLPRQVAYTYALEFLARDPDAEEDGDGESNGSGGGAFIDPGDKGDFEFDQPVYHYLENFIGFPVGEAVPMGAFEEDASRWEAYPDGNVIEVLGVSDGKAEIDLDGEGETADETLREDLSFTDAELEFVAEEYAVGEELWRTPVPHFSTWDCNWPVHPPTDVDGPVDLPDGPDMDTEEEPCEHGSMGY